MDAIIKFSQLYRGVGITSTGAIAETKEYRYKCYAIVGDNIYMIDPYFTAYAKNSTKAKEAIAAQRQLIDIIEGLERGQILKYENNPSWDMAQLISRGDAIRHGINI